MGGVLKGRGESCVKREFKNTEEEGRGKGGRGGMNGWAEGRRW